eukprot:TRINITY_DN70547_c0_g1_i1.p1 TRINITY_DN70547_c0_g1~~TRINITY_DN70547_c0_g1_i1.p1  ORF type:complete len:379 (+),score=35.84 TRINITY_DN70547_c0_g1_i1:133-1269(+)
MALKELQQNLRRCTSRCIGRELGIGISMAFALISLTFCCIYFLEVEKHRWRSRIKQWARRQWTAAECTVLRSGIEYTGDCFDKNPNEDSTVHKLFFDTPTYNYSHCTPHDAAEEVCHELKTAPMKRVRRLARATAAVQRRQHRRLYNIDMYYAPARPGEACLDSFMPWAEVTLRDRSDAVMCSTRTGIQEGSTLDWASALEAHSNLKPGTQISCWIVDMSQHVHSVGNTSKRHARCNVAAFDNPRVLLKNRFESSLGGFTLSVVLLWAAVAFCCVSVVFAVCSGGGLGGICKPWLGLTNGSGDIASCPQQWEALAVTEDEDEDACASQRNLRYNDRVGLRAGQNRQMLLDRWYNFQEAVWWSAARRTSSREPSVVQDA